MVTIALAALGVLVPAPARADLADDAGRLARLWTQRGAAVTRHDPVFLEQGRARTIAAKATGEGCLTVAFVAVRTAEFAVWTADGPARTEALARLRLPFAPRGGPDPAARVASAGGAAVLSRCGEKRAEIARLTLEMGSPRAAVEILVARSDAPLGELREVLPERAAGPVAPRGDLGGPLEPGPVADRLARAERRARLDGAVQITRTTGRAAARGVGEIDVLLAAGCHRVEVMAEVPAGYPHRATDLDAEAREQASGRLLARDRGDVPDARLDFCLGEATTVAVPFAGAGGAVPVVLSDARWPVPPSLPARWGTRALAGLAGALHRRKAPAPRGEPLVVSLGVQGITTIPIEVEPGRCYLAAMAMIRGEARSIRLSAPLGDRTARDDVTDRPEGAALAFCADAASAVAIDVEVRASAATWVLAAWPMGAAAP